jgi:hypothetical protein
MKILVAKPLQVAAAILAATIALAPASSFAQGIYDACSPTITKYCSEVTPGNGRMMTCLYSFEDKVSEECDIAIGETADVLDLVFERIRYIKQQCGADIAELCSEVELGHGQVFTCLHEKRPSLSGGCLEVVDSVSLPER